MQCIAMYKITNSKKGTWSNEKKGTRKFLSIVVVLVIAVGAFVSFKGIGPVPRLADKMKYGLDINGGVYVLMEAETNERVRSCLN